MKNAKIWVPLAIMAMLTAEQKKQLTALMRPQAQKQGNKKKK